MCQGFKGFIGRNLTDIKARTIWQGALAEILGTAVLVLVGCGTCLGKDWEANNPTIVQISLTFGLAVATVVRGIGHVSGGHINPAVTCAMLMTRRATLFKALLYITAQCLGAVAGAGLLRLVTPPPYEGDLGQTSVSSLMSPFPGGYLVETIITFILVFTVFAACDANRQDPSGSTPLSIGFAVAICHMFAIKYTGSSMNPARTFGPAVVGGNWENHWIFWCGPITGGVTAGLIYEFLFASNATPVKLKNYISEPGYNGDRVFGRVLDVTLEVNHGEDKALNDKA